MSPEIFARLETLIEERPDDIAQLRDAVKRIRTSYEILEYAQGHIYASIASRHLKVLRHLEAGRVEDGLREAAVAIAWFHHRFSNDVKEHSESVAKRFPEILEVFRNISDELKHSKALQSAMAMSIDELSV